MPVLWKKICSDSEGTPSPGLQIWNMAVLTVTGRNDRSLALEKSQWLCVFHHSRLLWLHALGYLVHVEQEEIEKEEKDQVREKEAP